MYFWFIIISLAVWRLTHLLSTEDGPFDIVFLIRKKAGTGFLGKLLDCFYCTSIWVALPFGIWQGSIWWQKLLYWLAFSAAACLLEQATAGGKNNTDDIPHYKED
ncbi:DUF1360 domain-containing protein [Ginsengibacter hankyongi]|uniref:DUF1360 domain-containing protein n=1 Tax=Ginsengibacter hankyongi TaxID=2607284 RepID=A0A5J5IGQ7_9BACT|nr:DUF1360 domain-containing protein [Ginsengibacter hankyongi]KAA9038376.1 DUF1360 domain-containing protein [Ginsengibacter hankyongi]